MNSTMPHQQSIRILVVGDSGVGKTSLLQLLCGSVSISDPPTTCGASVDVMILDLQQEREGSFSDSYLENPPTLLSRKANKDSFFIEFLEVGGSSKFINSRKIFYSQFDGILLVYDTTNNKSFQNLHSWLNEVSLSKYTWKNSLSSPFFGVSNGLSQNSQSNFSSSFYSLYSQHSSDPLPSSPKNIKSLDHNSEIQFYRKVSHLDSSSLSIFSPQHNGNGFLSLGLDSFSRYSNQKTTIQQSTEQDELFDVPVLFVGTKTDLRTPSLSLPQSSHSSNSPSTLSLISSLFSDSVPTTNLEYLENHDYITLSTKDKTSFKTGTSERKKFLNFILHVIDVVSTGSRLT